MKFTRIHYRRCLTFFTYFCNESGFSGIIVQPNNHMTHVFGHLEASVIDSAKKKFFPTGFRESLTKILSFRESLFLGMQGQFAKISPQESFSF